MDTKHVKHLVNVLLLLWSMQAAFCKICGSDFEDIRSRALLSDLVAEGTVDIKYENRANPRYNVSVLVSKIFKGSLNSNTRRRVLESIRIGEFGPLDKEQCLIGVTEGLKYVFFLRPTRDKDFYKHASLPVESSKKTLRQVRGILCKNCAKPPEIKPIEDIIIEEGESVRIKCRVKGYPKPLISWAKNGKVLKKRKGVLIRNTSEKVDDHVEILTEGRGSTVRIKKLRIRDAGNYACIARNALQLTREEMFLAVTPFGTSGKTRRPYKKKTTTVSPVTSPPIGPVKPNITSNSTKEPTHILPTTASTRKPISITSIIRSSTSRPLLSTATTSKSSTVESILNGKETTSTTTTVQPIRTTVAPPESVTDVEASQIAPTGHYYPCEKQTYCLNGGTCVYLPAFKAQFCRCPPDFTGERCETKDLFILLREIKMAEHQHQDRVITILGIVIGLLVLIGIFIGAYCKARKRRKALHERQELKRRITESLESDGAGNFPKPNHGKKSGSSKPTMMRSNSTTQTDAYNIKESFPTMPNGKDTGLDTADSIQNGTGGMRPRLPGVSSTPQCVRVEHHDNPGKVVSGESSDGGSKGSTPSQSSQTESAMQSWPPPTRRRESNSKPDSCVDNDLNQSDYENLDSDELEGKLGVVPPYLSQESRDSYTGPRDLQSTKRNSGGTKTKADNNRKISQRKSAGLSSDSGSDSEDTSSSGGAKPECEELLDRKRADTLPNRWSNSHNSAGNKNCDRYGNSPSGLTVNSCAFSPYYDVNSDRMDNRYPHRQKPHCKLSYDKEQRQRLLRTQDDHDATRL
ncbi:pro-neuregulin-1, membrane-bound isoform-like isoform X2 [Lineus longissimus]|uniref:pro-neuregulin-1, membrane-bound isoform-like isoform X2 n=1 Tax=Lineus longissimus TaxID=88925 RepID=UPI00315CB0F2